MLQSCALKVGALHSWLRPYTGSLALGRVLTREMALLSREEGTLGLPVRLKVSKKDSEMVRRKPEVSKDRKLGLFSSLLG